MGLAAIEQETIICFNKKESTAHVFTYEMTWQRHIETRFGIKPYMTNSRGGKWYEVPKSRIGKPRAPKKSKPMSEERKKALLAGLARGRKTRQAVKEASNNSSETSTTSSKGH